MSDEQERDEEDLIVMPNGWQPGDPCGICGSTETGWDIVEGAICRNCGGMDFEG